MYHESYEQEPFLLYDNGVIEVQVQLWFDQKRGSFSFHKIQLMSSKFKAYFRRNLE